LSQEKVNGEDVNDWKELLSHILRSDQRLREEIAKEIGVNGITLGRWLKGESKPRVHNLRLLLQTKIISAYRNQMIDLLQKAFPEEDFTSNPAEMMAELVAEDYAFILSNIANLAPELRTWTVCELLLDRLARQVDHPGLVLLIIQCEEPSSGKVKKLQERMIYTNDFVHKTSGYMLGVESLAGRAVQEAAMILYQDQDVVFFSHFSQELQSSVALPLKRDGMIAGCLVVGSPLCHYFSRERLMLLKKYADLLALAFKDKQFYPLNMIELEVILPGKLQQDAVSFYASILSEYLSSHQQSPVALSDTERFIRARMKQQMTEE
jgi:transcriptional regulator with XRE-family HTH domain